MRKRARTELCEGNQKWSSLPGQLDHFKNRRASSFPGSELKAQSLSCREMPSSPHSGCVACTKYLLVV